MSASVTTTRTGVAEASAHRGDSSRFRENTLPAIRSAIAADAEFVEIDVRLTAEGAVVVLHDPTLERLWGRDEAIAETSLARVRELGGPDHRPPLLSEVLELFEGAASTLLIDMDDPSFAEPAWLVAAPSSAAVAWCGDLDGMRTIRALDPDARIWLPWNSPTAPTAADVAELSPERVNSNAVVMTADMVRQIHSLGCAVTVWTVDDELTMRWATGIGIDTITTNQLPLLQRVIAEGSGAADRAGGRGRDDASVERGASVDLDAAIDVARGLAAWAIHYARSADPGRIDTKVNPADLVTEVDVTIERHVREIVGFHFPDHHFVGEELGGRAEPGRPCWYLDPVDGTTNFANRLPWNAFSLALAVDDEPLVAVVADPWRADLFEAVQGRGARLNGRTLHLRAVSGTRDPATDPLAGRVVSTELAAHVAWPGMLELLTALGDRYCTLRIMGSGTLSLVGVAAGRGAGAVIGRFGAVDHVAATLIVHEAGGVVLDEAGQPSLFPAEGGILVAAPEAADALSALWREARRAAGCGTVL
jgi:myo-inositol-1(or 4)-monophosphatase/deoxyribonuclease-2